jgi:branched-chain amino acid transport system substrate-binding protein
VTACHASDDRGNAAGTKPRARPGGNRMMRIAAPLCAACLIAPFLIASRAHAAEPIKIGMAAQLTGQLAASGKASQLAEEIWVEDVMAKGGLLGRPVQLVHYDDQSNPGMVPGIYTKLIDVDKADLLIGEGTNFLAPAMPVVMERQRVIMALLALAVNDKFHYERYFQSAPWGPHGKLELSRAYFEIAKTLSPMPQTVALVGADAEFSANLLEGARANAKQNGLKLVYDGTYPPNTVDYSAIMRGIQAAKPDLVYVASYPVDTVGMVRAAREADLKTMMFGGGMVGTQYASTKIQLGETLNGVVSYEFYVPEPTLEFPGIAQFLQKYQARAREAGVDQLGFYQPPFAYAAMQVIEQAVTATGGLDDTRLADYIHRNAFETIVGEIRFDAQGEWVEPRVLGVQLQNIKGNGLEQFTRPGAQVVLYPPSYKSGALQAPYGK